jgi:hypothetical protein
MWEHGCGPPVGLWLLMAGIVVGGVGSVLATVLSAFWSRAHRQ